MTRVLDGTASSVRPAIREAAERAARAVDRRLTRRRINLVGAALSVGGFVIAVVAFAATNAFTSDDVAIQGILQSLQSGAAFAPVVGGDNFVVKVPLYLLIGGVLPNGTTALVITVLLCDAPLLIAIQLIAIRSTAAGGRASAAGAQLLVVWFLASRITTISSLMIPNGRNGEIGVVLLVLWWWLGRDGKPGWPAWVTGTLILSAIFFSDGFFLFVLGPAVVGVVVVLLIARAPGLARAAGVATAVVAAGVVATVAGRAAQAAGLEVLQNYVNTFPAWRDVPDLVSAALGAVARNLNGDLPGSPLGTSALPSTLQVLLAVLLAVVAIPLARRAVHNVMDAMLLAVFIVNVVLYVATSNAADPYSFRYVLLAAVVLLLLGVRALVPGARLLADRRLRALVALVGVVAVVAGLGLNARTVMQAMRHDLPDPQERTRAIIRIAEDRGLSVGWGNYWDANITTYFSSRAVRVLPVDCVEGKVAPRAWLINRPDLDARADRVFVVTNTAVGCDRKTLVKHYGSPAESVPLPGGVDSVLLYPGWRR